MNPLRIDASRLLAIDVHVHLESPQSEGTRTDSAARRYFGDSGAPREPAAMADFEKIAIGDEVRPLILKENAVRLFELDHRGA